MSFDFTFFPPRMKSDTRKKKKKVTQPTKLMKHTEYLQKCMLPYVRVSQSTYSTKGCRLKPCCNICLFSRFWYRWEVDIFTIASSAA